MTVVHDIDRPDVGGVPPKMQAIRDEVAEALEGLAPVLRITTNDNLMSSVSVWGSLDEKETWTNSIYENSRHFRFAIVPQKGRRYYQEADEKITVELGSSHYKLYQAKPFRKGTTTVDKAIQRIRDWVEFHKDA